MRAPVLCAVVVVLLASGCASFDRYAGNDAACLEAIPIDARAPAGYVRWLRYWQSTAYCERVRARWFAQNVPPDLIVERIEDLDATTVNCPSRAGMQVPPDVWVKNQGRGNAAASQVMLVVTIKDANDAVQFETSYIAPVPALAPGVNHRANLSAMRPYMTLVGDRITLLAAADPVSGGSPRGMVAEADENNNTLERRCTVAS